MYTKTNGNIAIDDFIQTIFLILLEYDNEKLNEIYNAEKLHHLLVGIIRNQNCDPYSVYNKTIHQPMKFDWYSYFIEMEVERDQELLDQVEFVIHSSDDEKEYFYKKLLDLYVNHNETYRSLSKKFDFDVHQTFDYVKIGKQLCRIELNKYISTN
jgi:hypothetical protein